jgi:hypothetical protein
MLTVQSKEQMEDRLEQVLQILPEGADRPRLGPLQKRYMSNRQHAVAFDSYLRSVTGVKGLIHFKAEGLAGRLSLDETRYFVAFNDLPDDIKLNSVGMVERSCVHNKLTNDTRLEVKWGEPLPSVWPVTDGGADQFPCRLKLFYKYNIRGCEKYDPPHRSVRVRERAIVAANGGWIKSEYGIVFGFVRAPWGSEANWQLTCGAAKEMFANYNHDFCLFRDFIYERLCRARYGTRMPQNFSTDEHRRYMWEECRTDKVLTGLSEDYTPNRWKCFSDRFEWYWESFDVLLLIGLYVLITRGVCKNLSQDFPNLLGISKWLEAQNQVGEIAEADEDLTIKGLKAASKALDAKRKGSGSLAVCCESLCNTTTRRLGLATVVAPKAIETKMSNDINQCGTQRGCYDWHIAQAEGASVETCKEVWKTLEDWQFLEKMSFMLPHQVMNERSMLEDSLVAKYVFDLCKGSVQHELRTGFFYTDRPPYGFIDLYPSIKNMSGTPS